MAQMCFDRSEEITSFAIITRASDGLTDSREIGLSTCPDFFAIQYLQ
jgi:hypothetical protein